MVSPAPVVLLVGDEKYLKEKAIAGLRASLLDNSSGDLDYKVLHGADTSGDEIIASVNTVPFFSKKRLVVVRDFEKLPEEDAAKIISYIKSPRQHTCLVIDIKDDNMLKKNPKLSGCVKIARFADLEDEELSGWITQYVSSKGRKIEASALEILKELKGGDLLDLSQELEKLMTFSGNRIEITRDDVEALVGKSMLASAFDIADAVGGKNASRAVEIAHGLMTAGKKPPEIIGILAWHFKNMLKAKRMLSKGSSEFSVAQALRIPRKKTGEFFAQLKAFSPDEIYSKLEALLEADLNIKRPRYSPLLAVEFAIIRLCLGSGGEPFGQA